MCKKISYILMLLMLIAMIGCGNDSSSESLYDVDVLSKSEVNSNKENLEIFAIHISDQSPKELEEIGEIENIYLSINNVVVELRYEFIDRKKALTNISKCCKNVLHEIQTAYSLDVFSEKNWNTYEKKMWGYLDENESPQWYNSQNEEFVKLANFFDIYENSYENKQLIDVAKNADSVNVLLTKTNFISMLPGFKKPFCEALTHTVNKTIKDFDLTF